MSIKELRKAVKICVISNSGNVGKSIISLTIAGEYQFEKVDVAKFVLDKHHQELLKAYGTKNKGKLVDNQHAVSGVEIFDVREDGAKSITNLNRSDINGVDILEDYPADGIDELNKLPSIEIFVKAHERKKYDLWYIVPIASKTKCIESAEAIIETFNGVESDIVNFIFVFNDGLMGKDKKEAHEAFAKSSVIQEAISSGKAHTMTMKTMLRESTVDIIKGKQLSEIEAMAETMDYFDYILLEEHFNDFRKQFLKIVDIRVPIGQAE